MAVFREKVPRQRTHPPPTSFPKYIVLRHILGTSLRRGRSIRAKSNGIALGADEARVAQIFSPTADTWLRAVLVAILLGSISLVVLPEVLARSQYETDVARTPQQPVPFSHKHHAGELGIDCRYCHTNVESGANAGFPATHVCMTCHSQLWTQAPMLAPVRESLAANRPIVWQRVALLPDYVYFRHDIHLAKGVSCFECHGRIDRMPLTWRAQPFEMRWCLSCHRDPAPHLRPREALLDADWTPPADRRALGEALMRNYHIHGPQALTHCTVCHR
jgi:class III cytochrome C family protein